MVWAPLQTWIRREDSNLRPSGVLPDALPTELRRLICATGRNRTGRPSGIGWPSSPPLSYRGICRGTEKAAGERVRPGGLRYSCLARLYCLCPDADTLAYKSAIFQ